MTKSQCRDEFLRHVSGMLDYWMNESRAKTTEAKLEGLAFSILVAIDGDNLALPSFRLETDACDEDPDILGRVWPSGMNISGDLHENWNRVRKSCLVETQE